MLDELAQPRVGAEEVLPDEVDGLLIARMNEVPDGQFQTYTVKPGDTLGKIAAANGTSWQSLYAKNRGIVSNPNMIYVGQLLAV